MIIEFSVANYRSIHEEQCLCFEASADKSHEQTHCLRTQYSNVPRLLRTAVLLGPNASGKSNLLTAIDTLRRMVVGLPGKADQDFASRYTPFYSAVGEHEPTTFKIDLLLDRTRYRYHLSYNADRVVYEELRVYFNHKFQRWFARRFDESTQEEKWETFSSGLHGPRELWRKATGPRALYLSTAARLNSHQLTPLLEWFENKLDVRLGSDSSRGKAFGVHVNNPKFKERALDILRAADFAVTDMRLKDEALTPKWGAGVELLCERNGLPPIWLTAEEYSSGAKSLIHLLVPILDGLENDRFVVIDEFDTHLHPLVGKLLLHIISNSGETGRQNQVLFVSHTTALMDLDVLRRDELWLMQIDEHGASHLQSLKAFSPRRNERVARGYLEGKFGALPQVALPSYIDEIAPLPTLKLEAHRNRQ